MPFDSWDAVHFPAANIQATATKASAGAGLRNVCNSITVTFAATATAPTAVNVSIYLIDGASGGTAYRWGTTVSLPAVAGATTGYTPPGLTIRGSVDTAMTLEFSAAGGANTVESVTMSGVTERG